MDGSTRDTRRSPLAACLAGLLGCPVADVPLADDEMRRFLARRALGLVAVAAPADFAWAGPWIGVRAGEGGEPVACVAPAATSR